jgi:hypothetical protein
VDVSNVALIDPETGKPTRIKIEVRDGKRVRVAKSGKLVPEATWAKKQPKPKIDDEQPAEDEQ